MPITTGNGFKSKAAAHLGRFFRRLSYSVSIAVFVWFFHNRGGILFEGLSMALDFPVALAGRVFVESRWFKGIDLFFGAGVGEFMSRDNILLWHLKATILVYLPGFYGLDVVRYYVKRHQYRDEPASVPGK